MDYEKFINRLIESGYTSVTQVGIMLSLQREVHCRSFSNWLEFPIRIEIYDEKIETIKLFDPETQISHKEINQIELLPGRSSQLIKLQLSALEANFVIFLKVSHQNQKYTETYQQE